MPSFNLKNLLLEKIAAKEAAFFSFIKNCPEISEEECVLVEKKMKTGKIKKVVHVFFVFLIWSGVASIGDAILFSSSVVMSFMNGTPEFLYFFLFLFGNAALKVWYIHSQLPALSWKKKIISVVPYFGGGYLLAHTLKKEKVVRRAVWKFLKK